jgi:hypothetical protein
MKKPPVLFVVVFTFCLGWIAGNRFTWWYFNRVWKRHPERFKTIIDGVIALRESKANKQ